MGLEIQQTAKEENASIVVLESESCFVRLPVYPHIIINHATVYIL